MRPSTGKAIRKRTSKGASASRKVIVDFPESLLKRTEDAAAALSTDRAKLIRSAVEMFLDSLHKRQIERELAEGYEANAALDLELCREFAAVDAEAV